MKKTSKVTHVNDFKGNQQISKFFKKEIKNVAADGPSIQINKKNCKNIVHLDSDDDFVSVPSKIQKKKHQETQKKTTGNDLKSSLPLISKDPPLSTKKGKRKAENILTNVPKRTITIQESNQSPDSRQPSTSEYGNVTPTKNVHKQIVFIKSPEKLLSPAALKEYLTPEKQAERFLDKIKTPTPRKLMFDSNGTTNHSLLGAEKDTLLSNVDAFGKTDRITKKTTPKKVTPKKERGSGRKPKFDEIERTDKTPNKSKRTPKKLFEKSPENIDSFNVQIIDNFIKITPSKSNKIESDVKFVKSSEKKQSSILKYVSPSLSSRSLEAQQRNESTPTKEHASLNRVLTPISKAKTKLDFAVFAVDRMQPSSKLPQRKAEKCKSPNCKESLLEDMNPVKNLPINNCSIDKEHENDLNFSNIDLNTDDGWDEDFQIPSQTEYNLDLTESQHCKIISINPFANRSVLVLKSTRNGELAICNLEGFWVHVKLAIGDTVHLSAKKLNEREWIVNNDHGLLVYEPDLLISSTSVVNALWCKRKTILSERFHGFEPSNQFMLVGNLVHSLLQHVLKTKTKTRLSIEKAAQKIMKDRRMIRCIYECGVTLDVIEKEVMKFVPKIVDFLDLYVDITNSSKTNSYKKDDWRGTIEAIDDIEENIWCPNLGIKGKVDVSIKARHQAMPLELKTGRATVSLEHRGQVMLYIMMMNKLGYDVNSGLLLYLREGILREIPACQREQRDLMILRNELTYYLTRNPKITQNDEKNKRELTAPDIPEPINHPSCAKCPYNVICAAYARFNHEDISTNKVLKNIQDEVFFYLDEAHLNYFMHWVCLIALESNSSSGTKNLREIYTLSPQDRENNGRCIINLQVTNVGDECNGIYEHTFEKSDTESIISFLASGIMETNYVVVSVDNRPAVASGFVTDISAESITVTLDRNLNEKYSNRTFHIDSYDSSSAQSFNFASLTLLLELTPKSEKLRRIVIDKMVPTFQPLLPKLVGTKGKGILRRLNVVQQRAVLKAIAANDYFLIKGMPGTGKTTTIVALVQLLVELNKSVLVTSHTHSAVDNVCIKLVSYGVKLLRLGSDTRIHPSLKEYSEHYLTKDCTTPEELEAVYNGAQVLAVTCLGSGHPVISKRIVDVCIVDESTQVLQSSLMRPLYAAKTFVLIGDPDQLPAVVRNTKALEMGMSESLFERLNSPDATIALNLNYRMNSTITALANTLTYNGELLIGNETVANATLKLPHKEVLKSLCQERNWILDTLDDSLEKSVHFLDTGPVWNLQHEVPWLTSRPGLVEENNKNDNQNCINFYETAVVIHIIEALLKAGVPPKDVGVIATYRAQMAHISTVLKCKSVDVSTVDQFQGKDKNIIIFSCTKSRDMSVARTKNKFEVLDDKRRLTVAITRAKHKLIIVGDAKTVQQYSIFDKLLSFIGKNVIRLDQLTDFNWNSVLDIHN